MLGGKERVQQDNWIRENRTGREEVREGERKERNG